MFDIGASELLLTVIVAIVVIGPKDLPLALRTAGRWIGKIRRVSNHFRTGVETMIREAELEEMEQKWREQNARIMADGGSGDEAGSQAVIESGAVIETGAQAVTGSEAATEMGVATEPGSVTLSKPVAAPEKAEVGPVPPPK